ncbi:hypothetical protein O181_083870 [Austropuccinia psidii MF-1]|uniref:Uncharacterized protein n=1 Tax=Austropuccinia psidii MF-1 TaxID=1389203 RepID=A0A9Q3FP14_9BASI|nr:hypothetical protein [Austropuccinia psidii MF-1]
MDRWTEAGMMARRAGETSELAPRWTPTTRTDFSGESHARIPQGRSQARPPPSASRLVDCPRSINSSSTSLSASAHRCRFKRKKHLVDDIVGYTTLWKMKLHIIGSLSLIVGNHAALIKPSTFGLPLSKEIDTGTHLKSAYLNALKHNSQSNIANSRILVFAKSPLESIPENLETVEVSSKLTKKKHGQTLFEQTYRKSAGRRTDAQSLDLINAIQKGGQEITETHPRFITLPTSKPTFFQRLKSRIQKILNFTSLKSTIQRMTNLKAFKLRFQKLLKWFRRLSLRRKLNP